MAQGSCCPCVSLPDWHPWPWHNRSQGLRAQPCSTEEQRRQAGCEEPSPPALLSPIPCSHLPADGTPYMFGLSTTRVHFPEHSEQRWHARCPPVCHGPFVTFHSFVLYILRAMISAGSILQGKLERWGTGRNAPWWLWHGLQGGWDPICLCVRSCKQWHATSKLYIPTAEVAQEKCPWG